jgi:hypothetical protein
MSDLGRTYLGLISDPYSVDYGLDNGRMAQYFYQFKK